MRRFLVPAVLGLTACLAVGSAFFSETNRVEAQKKDGSPKVQVTITVTDVNGQQSFSKTAAIPPDIYADMLVGAASQTNRRGIGVENPAFDPDQPQEGTNVPLLPVTGPQALFYLLFHHERGYLADVTAAPLVEKVAADAVATEKARLRGKFKGIEIRD